MQIINFYGNPNVGLFFYATDNFAIVPRTASEIDCEIIKKELKVKSIIKCDVLNASVNAIFLAGNNEILLAPKGISKENLEELKKAKIKIELIDSKLNALGNNIAIFKNKAVINPNFEKEAIEQLEKLGFEILKAKIAGVETIGANLIIFESKALINDNAKDSEIEKIADFLGIEIIRGTVNNTSPIVKAGFAKNKHGILVSKEMSGAEMMALEGMMKK